MKYKKFSIPVGDRGVAAPALPVVFRFFKGLPSSPVGWLVETALSELNPSSPALRDPPVTWAASTEGLGWLLSMNAVDKFNVGEEGQPGAALLLLLLLPPSTKMGEIRAGAGSRVEKYDWSTLQTLLGLCGGCNTDNNKVIIQTYRK